MTHTRSDIATAKDEWCTPYSLFAQLDREFHFDVDAACTLQNCKCQYGFFKGKANESTSGCDALVISWTDFTMDNGQKAFSFFLNPPYTHGMLEKFMQKAYAESAKGALVVCLVPFSGAGWFKRWCMKAYEIRIIGRVRFIGYTTDGSLVQNTPTFDSCLVVFDESKKRAALMKADRMGADYPHYPLLSIFEREKHASD